MMNKKFKQLQQRAQDKAKDAKAKVEQYTDKSDVTPTDAPRITNENVSEHREEVLSSARKYIYPLQHSKHRIVVVTTSIIITAFVVFMSFSVLSLYRLSGTSSFLYRVTQVVPFPVAKAGSSYVSYENYLFELRHYMYFYKNQQKLDFNTAAGKQQLADYKKRALNKVINDAYIKQLASQHHVSVSNQEVSDEITVLRRQNRLGGSEQAYIDALHQNFGWSVEDFRRVIKQQLLEQKVVSVLDQDTHKRAKAALDELKNGADFTAVAAKYSDDASTKGSAGDFGFAVDPSNRDISPITTDALFKIKPGQLSAIINTGYSLQILKNNESTIDGKIKGAHIDFTLQPMARYVNDQKEKHPAHAYISI
ncbi:MAG: SurA N-terminal domain-containing protein [Candidatus Saccharibacteria bacterium]